jgi:hypothetical protein
MILPVRFRFDSQAKVRIERKLPGPGKIMVQVGDQVKQEDVIGEAEVSGGFRKIQLGQILGVSEENLERELLKKPGETVYKGEPLAKSRGFMGFRRKVYLSPADGVLEEVAGGEVTIRFVPSEMKLSAGFSGKIEEVLEGKYAVIETSAARVRGVIGVGKTRFGNLKVIGKQNEFLLPQHLDSSTVGKIVVGGALVTEDTIEKALAIGVRGLVCGGINFQETLGWSEGSDIGLTIVATEGYGLHPLGEDVFSALTHLDGQYAAISGETAEIFIASEGSAAEEAPTWRELKTGDVVRVVGGQDLGKFGPAEETSKEPVKLPSGITMPVVTFHQNSEKIAAPWQNLEIIGFGSTKSNGEK